jgi:hypothetical protein
LQRSLKKKKHRKLSTRDSSHLKRLQKKIEDHTCWLITTTAATDESTIASLLSGIGGVRDLFLIDVADAHLVIEFNTQGDLSRALDTLPLASGRFSPPDSSKASVQRVMMVTELLNNIAVIQ